MKSAVYLETSVISYYTAHPSRDIVTTARQTITQEWWEETKDQFDIHISVLVVEETKAGDPEAAEKRQRAIAGLPILEINDAAERLANQLLNRKLIPKVAQKMPCILL